MTPRNPESPLITIDNVTKSVDLQGRSVTILKNVTTTVMDGSFTIIHGPSGSGKTTLLNVMTGLDEPTTGSVKYFGKNIYQLSEAELAHFRARTMGIVYQSNYWVRSLTVMENVALSLYFLGYTRENAEREAMESLRRVGMEKYKDTLPILLSGGEQQRVAMARALVSNPSYIVADEPTGNLDSKRGDEIINLLKYFHEELQRTVILVTHNESYLKHGTQVLHLKDGEITEAKKATEPQEVARTSLAAKSFMSVADGLKPIKLKFLVHMAFENIRSKRLRSGLTMLGMAIGIGSIFLLLSFGIGLQNLVQEQIISTDSVKVIDVTSSNSELLKLNDASVERFYNIPSVEKIGKQNISAGTFKLDSASSDAIIYGVDNEFLKLSNLTIVAGEKLNVSDTRGVMINESVLTTLGYKDLNKVIGKEVSLSLKLDSGEHKIERPFRVVGIVEAGSGTEMYISQMVYQEAQVKKYDQVKIVTKDQSRVPDVRRQLETFGYQTSSPLDTLEQVNRFFQFFNVVLVGFGSIGLFIAIIGIFNTLTIALLERVREIGLMIALGARRRDVRRLFITESLLITLIGGSVGVGGSIILGVVIDVVLNRISVNRGVVEQFSLFSTPMWLIAAAIFFMIVIGYLVSYIPARRAGRTNPIDALRRE